MSMNVIHLNGIDKLDYSRREAFNSLRTNIQFSGADIQTILFTSSAPGEGKSVTSF